MGGGGSSKYQRKSAKAAEKQAEYQRQSLEEERKMNHLRASRERKEAFREARAVQGGMIQQGVARGTLQSTGTQGAMASVSSQLGSQVSFLDEMQSMANQASIFNIEGARQGSLAAKYQGKAAAAKAKGQQIGSLVGAGIGFAATGGNPMGASMGASLGGSAGGLFS